MAKLSARGRREWVRATRQQDTPTDEATVWSRTTIAYFSDGTILTKRDVRFRSFNGRPEYNHTWGWKKAGKWKIETPIPELRARLTASGWTVEPVEA